MSFSSKSQREEGKTAHWPLVPRSFAFLNWLSSLTGSAFGSSFWKEQKAVVKVRGFKVTCERSLAQCFCFFKCLLGLVLAFPSPKPPPPSVPPSSHPSCQLSVACLSPLKWQFLLEGSMASNLFAQYSPGSLSQRLSWALLSIWTQLVDLSGCRVLAYQCIAYICHMRTSSPAWHKVHGGAGLSCGPWSGAAEGTPLSPVSVCKEDRHFWVFLGGPHTC